MSGEVVNVGLISDTHGLLRPAALAALEGVGHIVHAGDIGPEELLERLGAIAPVTAVRGNVDREPWHARLPWTAEVELAGHWLHARHIRDEIDLNPSAAGFSVVVYGHSHSPEIEEHGGVLWINPGSAGPRRFRLPISLALLRVGPDGPQARIVNLDG